MRCGSTEVADVVIGLGDADFKTGLARYAEFFAGFGADPVMTSSQFVFARTAHALHDFRRTGVEGQRRRQDHADRQLGAIGQGQAVADALAVKVNVGLGGDGNVVDFFCGHGEI